MAMNQDQAAASVHQLVKHRRLGAVRKGDNRWWRSLLGRACSVS